MKLLRNILLLLLLAGVAGVGTMFSVQNTTPVPLDVLIHTFEPKTMGLWILLAFALGGALGMLSCSFILMRMRASLSSHKRQLTKVKSDLNKLREDAAASVPAAQSAEAA